MPKLSLLASSLATSSKKTRKKPSRPLLKETEESKIQEKKEKSITREEAKLSTKTSKKWECQTMLIL
jgi:hypothetical protein